MGIGLQGIAASRLTKIFFASLARILLQGPTDTVAFHTQQAVEKTLKALLTFNQVEFPS